MWWKRKYNYSSSDERYLNATMEDVYSDYLEDKIADFNKEFGDNKYALQILRDKAKNKDFDEIQNKTVKEKLFAAFKKVKGSDGSEEKSNG